MEVAASMFCLCKSRIVVEETTVSRRNFHQKLERIEEGIDRKITIYMTARISNLIKKILAVPQQGNWCKLRLQNSRREISAGYDENLQQHKIIFRDEFLNISIIDGSQDDL